MSDLEKQLAQLVMQLVRSIRGGDSPWGADPAQLKLMWALFEADVSKDEIIALMKAQTDA